MFTADQTMSYTLPYNLVKNLLKYTTFFKPAMTIFRKGRVVSLANKIPHLLVIRIPHLKVRKVLEIQ